MNDYALHEIDPSYYWHCWHLVGCDSLDFSPNMLSPIGDNVQDETATNAYLTAIVPDYVLYAVFNL